MESSIVFSISRLSLISPSKPQSLPLFQPWKHRTPAPTTRLHCHKMYVPGHGVPPEKTAAKHLHHFFNFVAVKIVAAQLQSYNPEAYDELMEFLERHSLNDADKFCADLMRESSRHQNLALRIMEVRSAYCKEDFEWDNLKKVASKMMDESNTRLLRNYIEETSCLDQVK
ncbi:chaperonin-like RBCX protein 1, chloroplastic [Ipomoea triloba]|uniref:chaperonin-like RBCX protein 1, chloroplastic n=1 Tax=Ipomoea triloba TaxID=35885 RepID=UPI00125DE946|nr:chaperonin-like RBCX protein 1, chloroplastic [Ipomoea triloba]GMD92947.1 chaperonin-like RBCX protein 1, chloroplastic [Ipomoea batatas]